MGCVGNKPNPHRDDKDKAQEPNEKPSYHPMESITKDNNHPPNN